MEGERPEQWTDEQATLFTRLFKLMCARPEIFVHRDAVQFGAPKWETVAWNAAWAAAEMIGSSQPVVFRDDESGEVLGAEDAGTLQ